VQLSATENAFKNYALFKRDVFVAVFVVDVVVNGSLSLSIRFDNFNSSSIYLVIMYIIYFNTLFALLYRV